VPQGWFYDEFYMRFAAGDQPGFVKYAIAGPRRT
jgi:hypothetical protein